jgi:hypothetical protein
MKLLLFIGALLFSSGYSGSKKKQLLEICREYMPGQYAFLDAYSDESVNQMATGDSLSEYLLELPTVIHEANHHYNGENGPSFNKTRYYYTTGDEKFVVDVFPVFPSSEINAIAPLEDKRKIFRYNTYITSRTPYLDSRVNGIFGLLEEMNAYYHSMLSSLSLYGYYKSKYGFNNAEIYVNWLGAIGSYRYALNEFSIFISWYLQAARQNHPDAYQKICNSHQIKTMYRFLHQENTKLQQQYDAYLKEIVTAFGNDLQINNGAIFVRKSGKGYGLGDDRMEQTAAILEKPEHKILSVLLR